MRSECYEPYRSVFDGNGVSPFVDTSVLLKSDESLVSSSSNNIIASYNLTSANAYIFSPLKNFLVGPRTFCSFFPITLRRLLMTSENTT